MTGDQPADVCRLQGNYLYAKSGETVFRRTVRCHEAGMDPVPPTTPGYGENFDYSCHHLPL